MNRPCIGVCSNSTFDSICRGCGLTVEEYRDWLIYTRQQKLIVKTMCDYRLEHYDECNDTGERK